VSWYGPGVVAMTVTVTTKELPGGRVVGTGGVLETVKPLISSPDASRSSLIVTGSEPSDVNVSGLYACGETGPKSSSSGGTAR
jgi:hypothetical protein